MTSEIEKVEKIIKKIEEDSKTEVDALLKEVEENADKIIAQAEEKVRVIEEELVEKGKKEIEQEKQRIIVNAKIQSRKIKMDAKEEAIKNAFNIAEEELKNLRSSKDYPNIFQELIEEAATAIGKKDIEVIASSSDSKILSPDFLKKLSKKINCEITVSPETTGTYGGAIVRAKDKSVEVDNTLETRMIRMREDLRTKVAKILFG